MKLFNKKNMIIALSVLGTLAVSVVGTGLCIKTKADGNFAHYGKANRDKSMNNYLDIKD